MVMCAGPVVAGATAREIAASEDAVHMRPSRSGDVGPPPASQDVSLGVNVKGDSALIRASKLAAGGRTVASPSAPEYRRLSSQFCGLADASFDPTLVAGSGGVNCADFVVSCPDGEVLRQALFRRESPADPWVLAESPHCEKDLSGAVAVEFARLGLRSSVVGVQPSGGWSLVNLPTIVYADGAVQEYAATVLGTPVVIRATPLRYSWDFGEGLDPLVTTDPGRPYPDQTVSRPYGKPGTYTVTLTTTWSAQYRADGAVDWLPVAGTATTTTTAPPLTVYEARSHLVADPLR